MHKELLKQAALFEKISTQLKMPVGVKTPPAMLPTPPPMQPMPPAMVPKVNPGSAARGRKRSDLTRLKEDDVIKPPSEIKPAVQHNESAHQVTSRAEVPENILKSKIRFQDNKITEIRNMSHEQAKVMRDAGYLNNNNEFTLKGKAAVRRIQSGHESEITNKRRTMAISNAISSAKQFGKNLTIGAAALTAVTAPLYYLFTNVVPETETYKSVTDYLFNADSGIFKKIMPAEKAVPAEVSSTEIEESSTEENEALDNLLANINNYYSLVKNAQLNRDALTEINKLNNKFIKVISEVQKEELDQVKQAFEHVSGSLKILEDKINLLLSMNFDSQTQAINTIITGSIIPEINKISNSKDFQSVHDYLKLGGANNTAVEFENLVSKLTDLLVQSKSIISSAEEAAQQDQQVVPQDEEIS